MEIKQQLKLSQQLVMTPQLQQAIRLLQLSRLELIDEIRKELDANPVLADDGVRAAAPGDRRRRRRRASTSPTSRPSSRIDRLEDRKRDASQGERARRPTPSRSARSTGSSSSRTARSSSRCRRNRGGFEELPPIEQNLTKPAVARRPPAVAARR